MKTLKGIALLIIILAFGPPAVAQAGPSAASMADVEPDAPSPTPPPKQKIVEVKIQVDFAWKEDMLPLTEHDIESLLMDLQNKAPRLAGPETKVRYEMLGPSTKPAGHDASYQPARIPGWKSARVTMVFYQRLGSGLKGLLEARGHRVRVQRFLQGYLGAWLLDLDRSAGLSKRLKADVAARRDLYERRLGQLNPDEQLRLLARVVREIEIEEFAKQARNEAMAKKIHEIRSRAEAKSAADPILKELKEIAAIREETQKLAKQGLSRATGDGKNLVPEAEAKLRGAQVRALEARVKVAQRQEAIAVAAGGELLTKLTNEAAMLSIDLVEMQARSKITQHKRDELEATKSRLEESIEKAKQELKDAEPWRIISTPEPQVRPMGEKPRKAQG